MTSQRGVGLHLVGVREVPAQPGPHGPAVGQTGQGVTVLELFDPALQPVDRADAGGDVDAAGQAEADGPTDDRRGERAGEACAQFQGNADESAHGPGPERPQGVRQEARVLLLVIASGHALPRIAS